MIKNFLFLFLLSSINLLGQSNDVERLFQPTETDSLYILGIENYTKELDTLYANTITGELNSKIIYIEFQNYLSCIPEVINDYKIIRVDLDNRK